MIHYDYDLCCNEQCPKRLNCQRYMTYKYGEWEHCYVMRNCIDFQLLKERIDNGTDKARQEAYTREGA